MKENRVGAGRPRGRWSSDLPYFTPRRLKARLQAWFIIRRADRLKSRNAAQADALYRRACTIIEQVLPHDFPAVAEPLGRLAQSLYERGEYAEGGLAFRRVAAIYRQRLGSDDPTTAWSESKVAAALVAEGRYAEADELLRHALTVYERNLGRSHAMLADVLDQLGDIAIRTGYYDDARSLLGRALSIRQRSRKHEGLSWTSTHLALALGGVATEISNEGRLTEAERMFNEARELALAGSGPRGLATADVLGGLAWVKKEQGFYRRAEQLYREQYDILRESLEPPKGIIPVSVCLGQILEREANFAEAKQFFAEALRMREQLPDASAKHFGLIEILGRMARLELHLAHYQAADALASRSLTLAEPAHPGLTSALDVQADIRDGQARCQEAYGLLLRALAMVRQAVGPGGPDVAWTMSSLGYFGIRHEGLRAEAESAFQEALRIREQHLGPQHPLVAWALIGLAESFRRQRFGEARPLLERALEILDVKYGPEYPDGAESQTDLAEILVHQGELASAERLLAKAQQVTDAAFGKAHPTLAYVLIGVGHLDLHAGRVPHAIAAWQQSLRITEAKLGPDHPDLVECLDAFQEGLRELGRLGEAADLRTRADRLRVPHERIEPRLENARG